MITVWTIQKPFTDTRCGPHQAFYSVRTRESSSEESGQDLWLTSHVLL